MKPALPDEACNSAANSNCNPTTTTDGGNLAVEDLFHPTVIDT